MVEATDQFLDRLPLAAARIFELAMGCIVDESMAFFSRMGGVIRRNSVIFCYLCIR
jgi:hypothetical protein